MSAESGHKSYEWAERLFSGDYDIELKYRDMLAMVAARLMGNTSAAEHFYNQALVDGASDAELDRVVQAGLSAGLEIGDLSKNVRKSVEDMHPEEGEADQDYRI